MTFVAAESLEWRKSSRSGNSGNCVEIAPALGRGVFVRDSKHPDHGQLALTRRQWTGLADGLDGSRVNA